MTAFSRCSATCKEGRLYCVPHGRMVMFDSITTGSASNQRCLNTLSHLGHVEAIAAHHGGAQDHGQGVCNVLTTNVRRRTMHLRSPSRSQPNNMLLSSLLVLGRGSRADGHDDLQHRVTPYLGCNSAIQDGIHLTACGRQLWHCNLLPGQCLTGSKIPGPSSLVLAEGSMPRLPVSMDAVSDSMSPKMFPVTMVSKNLGFLMICIAALSTYLRTHDIVRKCLSSRHVSLCLWKQ